MGTRRRFLLGTAAVGGALVVGWSAMPPRSRMHPDETPLPGGPGGPAGPARHGMNGWVAIGSDDTVQVVMARSEMGQGIHTALAMVLADELDADWARVSTVMSGIDAIYNNIATAVDGLPFRPDDGGWIKALAGRLTAKAMREVGTMATGGSSSVKDLWLPMREAGASARAMLAGAAAAAWGVPAAEVAVAAGVVSHPSGRRERFGALAEAAARQPLPRNVVLKTPDRFTLIGRPTLRLDARSKMDGRAAFGIDTLLPGMRHAAVAMCPTRGGRVATFDAAAARALPGVQAVVSFEPAAGGTGGVAAVADTPWHAMKAAAAVRATWDHGPAAGLASADVMRQLAATLDTDEGFAFHRRGDVRSALKGAATRLQAEYRAPYLAHAAMEPINCTVQVERDAAGAPVRAAVWAPTQVPAAARRAAARALGLASADVTVHVTYLGGGFGRRLEVDYVAQAAAIAAAAGGTAPVQVLWSRADDLRHDLYRPACVARLEAGFDAAGRLKALSHTSAGQAIVPAALGRLFGLPAVGIDKTAIEGAFDQPYEVPAQRVAHAAVDVPLPVGFWRAVGHSHQAFFKEGFIDECAAHAGQDAVAFRLALLAQHPRHAAVLRTCAERAGWGTPPAAAADGAPVARGIALHESFGSIVAQAAEVSVGPGRTIRVHRVVCVVDCGTAVNPAGISQQMESGVVFGLSAALYGEIVIERGQVQAGNFHDQPVLRLPECPRIETHVMPSTAPPEGIGEPGLPPIAPAVAGALFALTGQRLRSLPLRLA